MRVSVIIPIYNVKSYLERCIKSVQNQSFKDLEMILIDDGSTDGSEELADQLAAFDSRIHVIHQKNQGISGARNTGLRAAKGEYVVFLDSDDEWLLPDGLEIMLRESPEGCDLIVFKRVDIWRRNRREESTDYDLETIAVLPDAQAVFDYLIKKQKFQVSACFLMTRRQILIAHDIFFQLGMINEDISWSLSLWQNVKTVFFHNLPFYGYYHRPASVTTTSSIREYYSIDKLFAHWKELCKKDCVNKESILSYLANLWVGLGYRLHALKDSEKQEAISILERHKDVLEFAASPKTHRTALLVKTMGIRGTFVVLAFYWRLRTIIKGNVV